MRRLGYILAALLALCGVAHGDQQWQFPQNSNFLRLKNLPPPGAGSDALRLQDVAVGSCFILGTGLNNPVFRCGVDGTDFLSPATGVVSAGHAANSVLGRSPGSSGALADISCPTPGTFLGNIGGTLSCAAAAGVFTPDAPLAFSGSHLQLTYDTTFGLSGSTLQRAALTFSGAVTGTMAAGVNTLTTAFGAFGPMTVLANGSSGSAVPTPVGPATVGQFFQALTSSTLGWGAVPLGSLAPGPANSVAYFDGSGVLQGTSSLTGLHLTTSVLSNDLITGLAGGQHVYGGTAAHESLTLHGTTAGVTSATFGQIFIEDTTSSLRGSIPGGSGAALVLGNYATVYSGATSGNSGASMAIGTTTPPVSSPFFFNQSFNSALALNGQNFSSGNAASAGWTFSTVSAGNLFQGRMLGSGFSSANSLYTPGTAVIETIAAGVAGPNIVINSGSGATSGDTIWETDDHEHWRITWGSPDGYLRGAEAGTPAAPPSGFQYLFPSTAHTMASINSSNVVTHMVHSFTLASGQFLTSIDDDGTVHAAAPTGFVPTTTTVQGTAPIAFAGDHAAHDWSTNRVASLDANGVTNSFLALMGAATLKGNNTAGTANAADLTATQVTAMLNPFTTSLQGLAPSSGGGTTNFLRADGTWAAPGGSAGINALTGDGTATGPGSVPLTLATVNSNVGTFTYGTFTVNAKGLITAASSGATPVPATRTLTMTAPMTCDAGSSCDLSANRTIAVSAFSSSVAGVVPASGGGTSNFIRADGTWAVPPGTGGSGINQLTGDVTAGPGTGSQVATVVNLPNAVTMAGDLNITESAAPSTPASGHVDFFADSTQHNGAFKNSSGTLTYGAQVDAGTTHHFLQTFAATGAFTDAQPAFTDISGTVAASQLGSFTAGSLLFWNSGLAQDNAKIFWDDADVRLGIGTNTPGYQIDVLFNAALGGFRVTNTSAGTTSQVQNQLVNNAGALAYYGISSSTYAGYAPLNGGQAFYGSDSADTAIFTQSANNVNFYTNSLKRGQLSSGGDWVFSGGSALATSATDGFVYLPTTAGVPSGTPTSFTGGVALVYDSTDSRLYVPAGASPKLIGQYTGGLATGPLCNTTGTGALLACTGSALKAAIGGAGSVSTSFGGSSTLVQSIGVDINGAVAAASTVTAGSGITISSGSIAVTPASVEALSLINAFDGNAATLSADPTSTANLLVINPPDSIVGVDPANFDYKVTLPFYVQSINPGGGWFETSSALAVSGSSVEYPIEFAAKKARIIAEITTNTLSGCTSQNYRTTRNTSFQGPSITVTCGATGIFDSGYVSAGTTSTIDAWGLFAQNNGGAAIGGIVGTFMVMIR